MCVARNTGREERSARQVQTLMCRINKSSPRLFVTNFARGAKNVVWEESFKYALSDNCV